MIGHIPVLQVADAGDVDRPVTVIAGLVLGLFLRLEAADFLSAGQHDHKMRRRCFRIGALGPVLDKGCRHVNLHLQA